MKKWWFSPHVTRRCIDAWRKLRSTSQILWIRSFPHELTTESTGCRRINGQKIDRKFRASVFMNLTAVKSEKKHDFILYNKHTISVWPTGNGHSQCLWIERAFAKTVLISDLQVFGSAKLRIIGRYFMRRSNRIDVGAVWRHVVLPVAARTFFCAERVRRLRTMAYRVVLMQNEPVLAESYARLL